MIKEWFSSLFTRSVSGAKNLGLVSEAVAIRARYERHKRNWRPHLDQTKATIREAIDEIPKDRAVMIIGAGECLDISISALSRHRGGAFLVDAVETKHIRDRIRPYPNISYLLHDVTGFIDDSNSDASLPKLRRRPGLIVSCNMLSQLYLPFANSPPQDDDDATIIRCIVEDHINLLKNGPCPALLITDYQKIIKDKSGETITETIPAGLLPDPIHEWVWDICPKGELGPKVSAQLKVGVWSFP